MPDTSTDSEGLNEPLNEREQEILTYLVEGLSNREIANHIHLAYRTVKWYNTQIYSKLGVNNRNDAVIRARELGLPTRANQSTVTATIRHNLPHQITPFVGRQQELDDLARLMSNSDAQLITILAPGGMGKTRLGLGVAEQQLQHFADGVYFVSLAPLSSTSDIVTTIAENIGFVFHGEDKASQQLVNFLKQRSMLLILDNFEHLLEGAALVTDIIQIAAHIKVLVTSRERLNIYGEYVYYLDGLALPTLETPEEILEYGAVKLFLQSAKRTRNDFEFQPSDFDFLAKICSLTAGMPLGIELAAGWVDVLSLEQIVDELQQGIDILETEMRDIPKRHQSLRTTFERTWVRLTEDEQQVFMRLSVFRGGFTLEAAQKVVGATVRQLRKLTSKALIQTNNNDRFSIHELVRQFGASKLDQSNELATVQANHAAYFTDFMAEQEHNLKNGKQLIGLTLIDHDFENMRLAWRYLVLHHQWDRLPKFRYSLWFYCDMRARGQDLLAMVEYTLNVLNALAPSIDEQLTLGRMLAWSSWFYNIQGFNDRARNIAYSAIEILNEFHDSTEDLIIAYHTLGGTSFGLEDRLANLSTAKHNYELAQKLGDATWMGQTAMFTSFIAGAGDGLENLQLAKKHFESTGDQHGLWMCCLGDALIQLIQDDIQTAQVTLKHGESLIAPFNSGAHLAITNRLRGVVALLQHDNERAKHHFFMALKYLWNVGYTFSIYAILLRIAQLHLYENKLEMAVAIMLLLDDESELSDLHYYEDEQVKAQLSYDELRLQLEHTLKDKQLDHLWEQVEKPMLSELVAELLSDFKKA